MSMQATITTTADEITIRSPFNARSNAKFRTVCGRFASGAWILPNTDTARDIVAELFGASEETVEVNVSLNSGGVRCENGQATLGGYVIAERRERDYSVKLADGVRLVSGAFCRTGGSKASPRVTWDGDVVVGMTIRRDFAEGLGLVQPAQSAETVDVSVGGIPHRLTREQANALLAELQSKLA